MRSITMRFDDGPAYRSHTGKEGWVLGSTIGGQWPLEAGTVTVAGILKDAGYTTGAFGKWGLGLVGTAGDPNKQGFDHFYGYICQRQAHTFYPNHLWRDGKVRLIRSIPITYGVTARLNGSRPIRMEKTRSTPTI